MFAFGALVAGKIRRLVIGGGASEQKPESHDDGA
jgi:hypothetical protein